MGRLDNKVAIVTGGATGIGEAISKLFALEGAKVVVAGFPQDPVNEVANEIKEKGGYAAAFNGDLSNENIARECVSFAVDQFNKLDILINNAGVFPEINELQEFTTESYRNLIKNNIDTVFFMTKHALPELHKTKGNIVAAGSEAGKQGLAENTPYGGTKGFIHAFIQGVAIEQAKYGVRANCVCPGPIDTAWLDPNLSEVTSEMVEQFKNATAVGRLGTPEEMANVYLFLASEESSYVTGELLSADGGVTITKVPAGKKADAQMQRQPVGRVETKHTKEGAPERR